MKKLALATAILASVFAMNTQAAVQGEVGATLNFVSPDEGDSGTGFGVDGTYFFSPLQGNKGPWNEAAFLEHGSNINGAITYADNDGSKVTGLGAGIEYYVPNSQFYVAGNIGTTSYSGDGSEDYDVMGYSAQVGFLPMPNLLIAAGVVGYDDDEDSGTDPMLRAKYVTNLTGGNALNLEATLGFGDDKSYGIGADFYFDPTFSVGATYSGVNYDSDLITDTDQFGIRAKKFFNQQVSLEGSVQFGDNVNVYGLRGAYRF